MNKEEIEIIEKEINNLNGASQCALLSGIERKDWINLANAMDKMLNENKQLKQENKMLRNIQICKQDDDLIIFVGEECKRFKINTNELLWIKEIGDSNE